MKTRKEALLEKLSKESEVMIGLAYTYAKNFVGYGEDVTKAWVTATQQSAIIEKAYCNGYYRCNEESRKADGK